ncbi:MAG: hypothetical protein IAF08_09665 [Rhizobacter sp.]|nr:hypothetical protein [Chlorobiales bacterium]
MRRSVFFLTLLLYTDAFADGWTQKKGDTYAQFSFGTVSSNTEFSLSGESASYLSAFPLLSQGTYSDRSLFLYSEWGLEEDLTLVVSTSFKFLGQSYRDSLLGQQMPMASGLGDTRVSLRVALLEPESQPFVLAVQAGIKLPTGSTQSLPPFGTGALDIEGAVQSGTSYLFPFGRYGYSVAGFGYRYRGGGFNNEFFYSIESGFELPLGFSAKVGYSGLHSAGAITTPQPGALATNQDLGRVSYGVRYNFSSQVGLSLDVLSDVSGRNTIKGNTVLIGIFFKSF